MQVYLENPSLLHIHSTWVKTLTLFSPLQLQPKKLVDR